jgi:microcystin-dependent protein
VVVGQDIYVAGAGGPGNAGWLQVSAKNGNQLTLLNPQPAPAIPLAGTGTSGLLGQLSGSTTDYVGGDNTCHPLVAALLGYLVPTGAVIDYAGATAPTGFLLAQGQAVSRTTYSGLYTALGGASSPWGQGDGSTTFNLPDLRSRVPVGAGQGTGLSNYALAATGGEEAHKLVTAEIPSHAHTFPFVYYTAQTAGGGGGQGTLSGTTTTSSTGGDGTHNNIQPYVAMNKIIKT